MKTIAIGFILAAVSATALSAQQYGRPAYPDNWSGGPPLPPLGPSPVHVTQSQVLNVHPRIVVTATAPSYYFAGEPVFLHPQTQLSRERAYQFRFGHSAPTVLYP